VRHVIAPCQERGNDERHRRERSGEATSAKQRVHDSKGTGIRAQQICGVTSLTQGISELADVALRIRTTARIDPGEQEREAERTAVSRRHSRKVR
jgi:hypothetical protein